MLRYVSFKGKSLSSIFLRLGLMSLILAGLLGALCVVPVRAGGGPGGVGTDDGASALKLWLKADEGVYGDSDCSDLAENGDAAACWADRSGHSYTVNASTNQPTYQTAVVNGQPVVRFTGDTMTSPSDKSTWNFFHDGSDNTTFFVWRTAATPSDKVEYYLLGTAYKNQAGHIGFVFNFNNKTAEGYRMEHVVRTGATNYVQNASGAYVFPANNFGISGFRFDKGAAGGDDLIYVNGAPVTSANSSGVPTSTVATQQLAIGYKGDGSTFLTGDVAEIIVFTDTLSSIERTHVDVYLMDKYDIDLNGTGIYASTYDQNVRGISKSANVTVSGSSAGLTVTDVDFLNDADDAMVFGHDVMTNTGVLDDVSVGFGARWSRVWHVVQNDAGGIGGHVQLVFDFDEAGDTLYDGNTYYLLTRNGTTGDFTSVGATTTVSGNKVIFDNVDVSVLGDYITLGRPPVVVTVVDDELTPDADCSLREAIQAANTDTQYGACWVGSGADTILLSNEVYALTLTGAGEDMNATGDLDITDDLAIVGKGVDQTEVNVGSLGDRVFDLRPGAGAVIFADLTLAGGNVSGDGGGVYNGNADLTLVDVVISDNVATGAGGGVYVHDADAHLAQTGASRIMDNEAVLGGGVAIYSGTMGLSGGEVVSNTASSSGGGVYVSQSGAILSQTGGTIGFNEALNGGGIYVKVALVQLDGGEVRENDAGMNGGGLYVAAGSATMNGGAILANTASTSGAGVYVSAGTATLSAGQVAANVATGSGGGVYVAQSGATFTQSGSGVIDHNTAVDGGGVYISLGHGVLNAGQILSNTAGANGGGVFVGQGRATWAGGQVVGNVAAGDGGGVYNSAGVVTGNPTVTRNVVSSSNGGGLYNANAMTLTHAVVTENTADHGGGIFNAGTMLLDDVQVDDNTATAQGGGIAGVDAVLTLRNSRVSGNAATSGGGVYLEGGEAAFSANTLFDNTAAQGGGGVYLNGSDAVLVNNIFAGNAATSGGGAALRVSGGAAPELVHNTIANNTGASGILVNGSALALTNTILVTHTTGLQTESGGSVTLDATLWNGNTSDWVGDNIDCQNDRFGAPAFEDPANDNYHLIPWISAAIDVGVDAGVTVDFEGSARPQGAGFDIGAFEEPETGLALVKTVEPADVMPWQTITYTLVYTNYGPGVAEGVLITDVVPGSMITPSFTSSGATITPTGSVSYTWDVENLAMGAWGRIIITGTIDADLPNGFAFANAATITTTTPTESVPGNNTGEVTATVRLIVNNFADELIDDGDCSLREAIQAANTDTRVDYCAAGNGDDTITLLAGTYTLSITGTDEDVNVTGDLDIFDSDALTITGAGAAQTIIDASGLVTDRAVDIVAGAGPVVLSDLAIINGYIEGGGGGVRNDDTDLTLSNVDIRDNEAANGGGVYVGSGSVVLSSGQIAANTAVRGGGLYVDTGSADLGGGQLFDNVATDGGGVFIAAGDAVLSGGQVIDNAASSGGGVYVEAEGATFAQTGVSTVTLNTADYGAGLFVNNGLATLSGGQVFSNTATGDGGGVYVDGGDAVLDGGVVQDNTAVNGGGVFLNAGGATLGGGGIAGNSATDGNAIYNAGGAITHTAALTLAGDIYQNDGTFVGGNASLALAGSLDIENGTFTAPSLFSLTGDFVHNGGTFAHNDGTVVFNGDGAQSISGANTFFNLTLANSSGSDKVDASGSTLVVANLLRVQDGTFLSASDYHDVQINAGAVLELSGDITVSGNWTNHGTLVHNDHAVTLDGGNQSIAGSTTFYDLTKNVSSAATLTFTAGTTQTIENVMDFQGVSGNLLSLRSSAGGSVWAIDPQGSRTIAYLDVKDSKNVNAAVIAAQAANSVDSGNNPGWNFHFPVAVDALLATDEDTPILDTLGASDADTDDTLVYAIETAPTEGALTFSTATGDFVYTPTNQVANYEDVFTFVVTDQGSLTDTATITIAVAADNDPPTLDAISDLPLDEDAGQQTVALSGITTGGETQTLTVTAVSTNTALIPVPTVVYTSPDSTGSLLFTPVADAFGTAVLEVSVTEGLSTTVRSFEVTVASVNDAPSLTLGDDVVVNKGDGAQVLSAWASDFRVGPANESGQALTLTLTADNPALFAVQPALDKVSGDLSFTPYIAAFGSTEVTVILRDDGGTPNGGEDTFTTTFHITITAPSLAVIKTVVGEDGGPVLPTTLLESGSMVTYTLVLTNSGNGAAYDVVMTDALPLGITFNEWVYQGSAFMPLPNDGVIEWGPWDVPADFEYAIRFTAIITENADFIGATIANTVFFTSTNADSGSDDATFRDGGHPPVFISTPVTEATEDVAYTYAIIVTDVDMGDILTFTATTLPGWLTLTDAGDGTAMLAGVPTNDDVGDNAVLLRVRDTVGMVATQVFSITVINTNDAPAFISVPVEDAIEGFLYTYHITATDVDVGDALAITPPTLPLWLTLSDGGDGTATLHGTPSDPEVGEHFVMLEVRDVGGLSDTQSFTITVVGVADGPTANDDSGLGFTTDEDTAFTTGNVLTNDTDPDTPALSVVSFDAVGAAGQVTDNGDGTFDYNPNGQFEALGAGEEATDVFTYVVTDGVLTDTATVTITLTGVNDAPTISDIPNQVTGVGKTVGPLAFTIGDVDTLPGALTLEAALSNSAFVATSNIILGGSGIARTVTLTPTAGVAGSAVITITVSDGSLTAYDTFELNIAQQYIFLPLVMKTN